MIMINGLHTLLVSVNKTILLTISMRVSMCVRVLSSHLLCSSDVTENRQVHAHDSIMALYGSSTVPKGNRRDKFVFICCWVVTLMIKF